MHIIYRFFVPSDVYIITLTIVLFDIHNTFTFFVPIFVNKQD